METGNLKILDGPESYTIAWIAALPIERAAAVAMLDEQHKQPNGFSPHKTDTNSYTWGRIGEHNIAIVSLAAGIYGLGSAAATASSLSSSLPDIRVGLLVGIGGGIARPDDDHDIRLGDVVVSQPDGTTGGVCQYDLVKAKPGDVRERKGFLAAPPRVLLNAIANIQAVHELRDSEIPRFLRDMLEANPKMAKKTKKSPSYTHQGFENDRLFHSSYEHVAGQDCRSCETAQEVERDERDTTDPEIHYGIIASGNTLVKDAIARDRIVADVGEDCLCFEMEAAGLMDHFPCLVKRGICDYADSHKNDRWQRYSSATAACYAKELLAYVPVAEIQKSKRALEILESVNENIAATQQTTLAMKATVDSMMLGSQSQKIRTWLAAPDPSINANHARELRHNGTGSWILKNTAFCSWKSGTYKHLWLRGMAGCGKTVLTTTVLDDLAKNNECAILSFFFDFSDTLKQTKNGLMRSLAFQLYQGGHDLTGYLESSFRAHEEKHERPTTTTLEEIVKVILKAQERAVIVLDALTYGRMLKRIPHKYWNSAVRLLRFIVHVKSPLTLEAAVDVAATEVEQKHPRFSVNCRMFDISDVLRHCPSLVSVIEVKDGSKQKRELHLAHFSVKEYLLLQENFGQMDASVTITKTCLTYLRDIEGSRWKLPKQFPLAEYAASVFMDFAAIAEASDEVSTLMIDFFQSKKTFNRWKYLLEAKMPYTNSCGASASYHSQKAFRKESALYFACLVGLITVARSAIDAGVSVNSQGLVYGNPLWIVSYHGHLHIVQLLLDNNADTYFQDAKGGTVLLIASRNGHLDIVRLLLDRNANINAQNDGGSYALHEAAKYGHLDIVRLLLNRNANIEARDSNGYTALHMAISNGHLSVVELLLAKYEDANVQRCFDEAAVGGHLKILEVLLNKYANPDVEGTIWVASMAGELQIVELLLDKHPTADVKTSLIIASQEGYFKLVELLLDHVGLVNAPDCFGQKALDAAISGSHIDIILLLLKKGAYLCKQSTSYLTAAKLALERSHHDLVHLLLDVNSADIYGKEEGVEYSLLPCTATRARQDLLQCVIDVGADINATHKPSRSALEEACYHGQESIVKMLLELGADVNGRPESSCGGPLQAAILNGHGSVVNTLKKFGADFSPIAQNLMPILHEAYSRLDLHIVVLLADVGLDIARIKSNDSRIAQQLDDFLGLACAYGKNDLVKAWVGVGANVNGLSRDGNHIQAACLGDRKDTIEVLIELGADINNVSHLGSALKTTARGGNAALVEMLLDLDADVNIDESESSDWVHGENPFKTSTPVSEAASEGNLEVAALLVEAGADVNAPHHGRALAPLAFASLKGHIEMVNLLLEKGANVLSECRCGHTAIFPASAEGHFDVVKLLLEKESESTSITSASRGYAEAVLQLINIIGIHPDVKHYTSGFTALSYTARGGHKSVIELLLNNPQVDINSKDSVGRTALSYAAKESFISVVELILNNPQVDVNSKDSISRTALSYAAEEGHKSVVELLLKNPQVAVDSKDKKGRAALAYAAGRGHKSVVELFQTIPNIDVDSKDLYGRTALFRASIEGHDVIVDILGRSNACADLSDFQGLTPLSVAARGGHKRVVEILLAPGATSTFEDHFGRTPVWWAKECGNFEILRALAPSETQQPQAPNTEANAECHTTSSTYCNVCILRIPEHVKHYFCGHCNGGNFIICNYCFIVGGRCLEESHTDTLIEEVP